MNTHPTQSENNNVILRKILSEEVSMRPKAIYRIRFACVVALIVLITIVSVFLFSFISFLIRTSEQGQLLHFGFSGIVWFILLFPWFLLFVDIALIAFLEYLLRHFRFGYRRSVVYLLLGLVIAIGGIGFIVDRGTAIHTSLLRSADADSLPGLGGLYERAHLPLPHTSGVCRCVITDISPLTARDDVGEEEFPVILSKDSKIPFLLYSGAHVVMLGDFSEDGFYADQIRILER
jgi:hypothetical protein